jgi:hypothetical protein
MEGLTLLGIDRKNNLYWDGERISTRVPKKWWLALAVTFLLASISLMADIFQIFGVGGGLSDILATIPKFVTLQTTVD